MPLLLVQWLALVVFALTVRHNSWLYYQGGDQTFYYTSGWKMSHWTLPTAEVGWGWSYLLIPIAGPAGPTVLSGLPWVILLDTLVLLPIALVAVYGIAARIGGRLLGYWAAALYIAVPYLAIPLWADRYHGKWVEQTLPQTLGLTPLADFPSMVLLLVCAYLVVRALDTGDWREPVLAGLTAGFALGVKPSNAIFFFAPVLAFLLARRWRQVVVFGGALAPGLVLLALWKQRGLGVLPLFTQGSADDHPLASIGLPLPPGTLASLGRYVHIDWDQLRLNRDALHEFFWSVRPLEWVPIAGVLAIGRRSWPKAALVAAWFVAFLLVKGSSDQSSVEDASFFRLMMPSFPAFLLLLAAIPLLVPRLAARIGPQLPAGAESLRRLDRLIVAAAALFVVVPLVLLAAARAQVGPTAVKNDAQHTFIPVIGDFNLSARSSATGMSLTWTPPFHGSVRTFYSVLRSRPTFPDPTNPEDRTVIDGVACRKRINGSAQDCHLFMRQIGVTRGLGWADTPPPGRWTYRVAMTANWIDDPTRGDMLLLAKPVTVTVR